MRWMFIGAAIILTGVAGVATAQDPINGGPPYFGGQNAKNVSVYANYSDAEYSKNFFAYWWTQTDKQSGVIQSNFFMTFGQWEIADTNKGRHGLVSCNVVDPNSLLPSPGRVVIALLIDDLTAAECSGELYTCDNDQCTQEPWTAPIEITGDMANMSLSSSGTEISTEIDSNEGSTRRYQCQLFGGESPKVGGVTFRDLDGDYDYIPFVDPYPDEPSEGTAQGNFFNRTCTQMEAGRKPPK